MVQQTYCQSLSRGNLYCIIFKKILNQTLLGQTIKGMKFTRENMKQFLHHSVIVLALIDNTTTFEIDILKTYQCWPDEIRLVDTDICTKQPQYLIL